MDRNKILNTDINIDYELNEKYNKLENDYNKLENDYNKLKSDYDILKNEYSENIIIQSMNDMKVKYDTLLKNTVPLFKFHLINEKYKVLVKSFTGCSILIDHIIKLLKRIDNTNVFDRKNIIYKTELELVTVKEILEDSICFNFN